MEVFRGISERIQGELGRNPRSNFDGIRGGGSGSIPRKLLKEIPVRILNTGKSWDESLEHSRKKLRDPSRDPKRKLWRNVGRKRYIFLFLNPLRRPCM